MNDRDLQDLPAWTEPTNLTEARAVILKLGQSLAEHAYAIGKALAWVKGQLPHGAFIPWVTANVWFSERTARRMIAFAVECDKAQGLLDYHPGKTDIMADLRSSELSAEDAERAGKLASAYEMLEEWDRNPSPEVIEARNLDAEYDKIRAKLEETSKSLETMSPGELNALLRDVSLEPDIARLKIRSLRGFGKMLNSIPKAELDDFLKFVNLPEVHRRKMAAERIAELI